jgi:hypothetical protein
MQTHRRCMTSDFAHKIAQIVTTRGCGTRAQWLICSNNHWSSRWRTCVGVISALLALHPRRTTKQSGYDYNLSQRIAWSFLSHFTYVRTARSFKGFVNLSETVRRYISDDSNIHRWSISFRHVGVLSNSVTCHSYGSNAAAGLHAVSAIDNCQCGVHYSRRAGVMTPLKLRSLMLS